MAKKEEKIAKRAYYKYLERGGQHGQDVKDWLEAEKEEGNSKAPGKKPATKKTTATKKAAPKKTTPAKKTTRKKK